MEAVGLNGGLAQDTLSLVELTLNIKPTDMDTEDVDDEPPAKKGAAAAAGGSEKPNRILFVSGLPSEATDEMLR